VFCTAFYLFLAMGLITATLTWVLIWGLGGLIKNPGDLGLFRALLLILGLNFAIDFPVRAFNAVFTSNIRDDISVGISMIKSLVATALIALAVKHGQGVMALAAITVGCSLLDSAARIAFAFRLEPALSIHPAHVDWTRVKPLFSYSAYSFVSRIGDILQFRIDNLVITAYIGLGAVTHYFVAARLIEYLREALSQSIRGMTPVFSQEEGRDDYASIRTKFLYVSRLTSLLATFVVGCALGFGRPFIQTWMGARFADSYPVLVALAAGVYFRMVQLPSVPLLYGISKHKYHAYSTLAEGLLNLVLSLILVKKLGILGVALGTQIPMTFMTLFIQPWYVSRVTGLSIGLYVRHTARNVAVSVAVFAVAYLAARPFIAPNYLSLVFCGVIVSVIYWPLAVWFGLAKHERDHLLGSLRRAATPYEEEAPLVAEAGK
jgi:O-antigen/teichoic acid export membrane protein